MLDQDRRIGVGYKPPQNFGDQFLEINWILANSDGQFLDGEAPGTFYFLFFGILQCHSNIPVSSLASVQSDELLQNIRDWISRMEDRVSGYGHSYTAKCTTRALRATPGSSASVEGQSESRTVATSALLVLTAEITAGALPS